MCEAAHASLLLDSYYSQQQKSLPEITVTVPACHLSKVGSCVSVLSYAVLEVKEEGKNRHCLPF